MMFNKDTVLKDMEDNKKFNFLLFYGHHAKDPNVIDKSCFSQWWPCNFVVDGVTYNCAEQFMMAEKARVFKDTIIRNKILTLNEAKKIKALGRQVKNFDATVWKKEAFDVVVRGNLAKFEQNADLLAFLKGTGDDVLVEASPYDKIWGIGMDKNNIYAINPLQWNGENLLGFALMEVRYKLMKV